jgi:DNA-binding NarL/FixJ family response regulator
MTRVLIATNEPIRAKGLEAVLTNGGMHIVGICNDVFELFERLARSCPDIAVLDLPVLSSHQVVADLQRVAPRCRFVTWPRQSVADSPAGLMDAFEIIAQVPAPDPSPSALVSLACSEMERELITLVGYGLNNEEIAATVGAARSTVRRMVRSLSDRLGAGDRCELALYGLSTLKEVNQERGV